MKLYLVKYGVWNSDFSKMAPREQLSVGLDEAEAIERIKRVEDADARFFSAQEITNVLGYKIRIQDLIVAQDDVDKPTDETEREENAMQMPVM